MASIAEVMTVEIGKAMKLTQGYMIRQQQGCVIYTIQALLQPLYHTSSSTVSSQCDIDHPLPGSGSNFPAPQREGGEWNILYVPFYLRLFIFLSALLQGKRRLKEAHCLIPKKASEIPHATLIYKHLLASPGCHKTRTFPISFHPNPTIHCLLPSPFGRDQSCIMLQMENTYFFPL